MTPRRIHYTLTNLLMKIVSNFYGFSNLLFMVSLEAHVVLDIRRLSFASPLNGKSNFDKHRQKRRLSRN